MSMTLNSDRYRKALACLEDFKSPRSLVWDCLHRLTQEDLQCFGMDFYFYRLNFFSLLGKCRSLAEINDLSGAAVRGRLWEGWSTYSSGASMLDQERQDPSLRQHENVFDQQLQGGDVQRIRELLKHGKGLILCAHHFGLYRYLPLWLASKGFRVCTPLDQTSFEQSEFGLRQVRTSSTGWARSIADNITLLNVEGNFSLKPLLRSLRDNQIVLIYVDGNTGADGPFGESAKSIVQFGGLKAQVKNGPARISAMSKAPLLEIIAPRRGQSQESSGDVCLGETFLPPCQADRRDREEFVEQCTQHLYTFLERHFAVNPEQWESCRLFHRWRLPKDAVPLAESDRTTQELVIRDILSRGQGFRLNVNLMVSLSMERDTWIDVDTLRIYRQSAYFPALFRVLSSDEGLRAKWIGQQAQDSTWESTLIETLAQLVSQNIVVAA
jgi:lauroyl/myristoyl acyltransferase